MGHNSLTLSKTAIVYLAVSEKKTFKDYQILYMYISQGQGWITPGG